MSATPAEPDPCAQLNHAIAEDRAGCAARARRWFRALAAAHPDWAEPLARLGQSLRAAGDAEDAAAAYDAALDRDPLHPDALLARAALALGAGAAARAHSLALSACGAHPDRADAWDLLGLVLQVSGDHALAETAFAEASARAPDRLELALRRVEAAAAAGTTPAALIAAERAAAADPLNPVKLAARALLAERDGQRGLAIEVAEAAAVLAPDHPDIARLLAGLLARSTRVAAAEAALARAVALNPADRALRNDHAATLMRLHRHAEAHAILSALLTEGPDANILCNLANATANLGRQREALALASQAIALAPEPPLPRRTLANALPYSPGVTGAALLAAQQATAARLPRPVATAPFANTPDPHRKLRLGLLSGTLRTHPVGWLTVAGFETLDPAGFETICLAPSPVETDPIARRFRALAAGWEDTERLTDTALAARARERGVDILIDLGGYGDLGRMAACVHRLAPLQVKWVGMQTHSTGLPEIDAIVTDRWETPPGFERFYSERLLRLADGYVCYSPPPYAPEVAPAPASRNGFVTFGCYNNLAKITPDAIALWNRILAALPSARLILKTHQLADAATAAALRAAFVAPARVETRPGSGHRAFLAQYNDIDIALDPFPYSGGLTTCEALWMGVPTIALPGEIFASRHSASHLCNAGLDEWVTDGAEAYLDRACAAAADLPALAVLRAGLRARTRASPLCDAPRFGRSLGAALRGLWREWCEAQP